MKKYWLKFKEWLVKKLGGQIAPLTIAPKVEYYYARPITLSAKRHFELGFFEGDVVFKENLIKKDLVHSLAEELLERGLVEITTQVDLIYGLKSYEARIFVYGKKGDNDERPENN